MVLAQCVHDALGVLDPGGLAKEGYETLKGKFASLDSVVPCWAARVAEAQGVDYAQAQRAAFEYAQTLFRATE